MSQDERWFRKRGDDAARAVHSICKKLEADNESRKARWMQALRLYDGKGLPGQPCEEIYNLSRSAVDTAQAEIAARNRPKPMFFASGADWRTKRKAKKLDRFVEATLHQRQGRYCDTWELCEDMFKAASIAVGAVAKVSADAQAERIRVEHIPSHEVLVDPEEAAAGDPQNWFHVYDMDLDLALEQFCALEQPEEYEEAAEGETDEERECREERNHKLRDERMTEEARKDHVRSLLLNASAIELRKSLGDLTFRVSQRVRVYEAWRLPFSAEKPGRHVFAVDGGSLYEEDWTWPSPPFAILVWSREMFGLWGRGLVEEGALQHEKVNEMAERLHERFKLCAQTRTFYEAGTVSDEDLQSNDSAVNIPVRDLSKVPRTEMVPPVTEAERGMLNEEIQRYYEFVGVSQMTAGARREPGVSAAIAMQTLGDIKSIRFLPKARAYELLFVTIGELIIRAARDLAIARPELIAKWPGKRFLQEIKWADVDLPDDMYEVRVAPVSAMSRDPAQRLEVAEQLAAAGRIPNDKYLQLLGLPDLDSYMSAETAETDYLEMLVDRYLDAEDSEELEELGGYETPETFARPLVALVTVQQMYFQAKIDGAPIFNLNLLNRYMRELEQKIRPPQQQQPAAGAPPVAPPMPGEMPAAPPAGPAAVPIAA